MHRQFAESSAQQPALLRRSVTLRFAGAVRAFYLIHPHLGIGPCGLTPRTGLLVDDGETRTPLEIAHERRAELGSSGSFSSSAVSSSSATMRAVAPVSNRDDNRDQEARQLISLHSGSREAGTQVPDGRASHVSTS